MRWRIGSALKSLARKVGNAAGKVVEGVGKAFHSEKIQDLGFKIQIDNNFGQAPLHESSSVARHVDVSAELSRAVESAKPSAKAAEEKLIRLCTDEVGELLTQFISLIPCAEFYSIQESYCAEIQGKLSGKMQMEIQKKLSLDDKKCLEILEIEADEERREKADNYKKTVLTNAGNHFEDACIKVKKEYCEKMLEIAEAELKKAEEEAGRQQALLEKMLVKGMDEQAMDLERESALITMEKLAILDELVFDG